MGCLCVVFPAQQCVEVINSSDCIWPGRALWAPCLLVAWGENPGNDGRWEMVRWWLLSRDQDSEQWKASLFHAVAGAGGLRLLFIRTQNNTKCMQRYLLQFVFCCCDKDHDQTQIEKESGFFFFNLFFYIIVHHRRLGQWHPIYHRDGLVPLLACPCV